MPDPNLPVLEFLATRRSRPSKTLGLPVPDADALGPILRIGLRVPDHKKLEPWRLIVLGRDALGQLADLVAPRGAALGRDAAAIDKQRRQFADAHLAVAVIGCPKPSDGVPPVEQALSAGAVCQNLLSAALAAGWGAQWLSGWVSHDPTFAREGLGLAEDEWIAGFIHIGTASSVPPDRPRPDPAARIEWRLE
ncbi:nitroreductase [Palleronia sediminis]|uniref:Putative NAD(P)H nitroreductase n=1 Tax=Palleronia sediminis TaxID=2547833 RepID=A0A4R6A0H6_9RHOB|nr:nitroreductase [Palleronia sediminis]TDL76052.1 nitroreductase [Palleronia sediminis]